jgi:hypothetical protein
MTKNIFEIFDLLDEIEELNKQLQFNLQNGYLELSLSRNSYFDVSSLNIPKSIDPNQRFIM